METRSGVAESLLTSAESTEVGSGLGDDLVEQLESDLAGGGTVDGNVEKDLAVYVVLDQIAGSPSSPKIRKPHSRHVAS